MAFLSSWIIQLRHISSPIDFGVDIVVYSATKFIGGMALPLAVSSLTQGNFTGRAESFPSSMRLIRAITASFCGALKPMGNIAYIMEGADLSPARSGPGALAV